MSWVTSVGLLTVPYLLRLDRQWQGCTFYQLFTAHVVTTATVWFGTALASLSSWRWQASYASTDVVVVLAKWFWRTIPRASLELKLSLATLNNIYVLHILAGAFLHNREYMTPSGTCQQCCRQSTGHSVGMHVTHPRAAELLSWSISRSILSLLYKLPIWYESITELVLFPRIWYQQALGRWILISKANIWRKCSSVMASLWRLV